MIANVDLDPVLAVLHDQHFTHAYTAPDGVSYARCLNPGCREVVEIGPRHVTLDEHRVELSDEARLAYAVRHREVCLP